MSPGPAWLAPMLASPTEAGRFSGGDGWVFERKLDGLRCVAVRDGGTVELWSRNHLSFTARFPTVAAALAGLAPDRFVLDGELVALDGDRTDFGRLARPGPGTAVVYGVFDLTHLLGRATVDLGLVERKALVDGVLADAPGTLSPVRALAGGAAELLDHACAAGWEGLVAKRVDAPYRSGRSRDWRKLKCAASQELVVGGWTEPNGSRRGLGALMVGYWADDGALRYAGRVGTGLTEAERLDLRARLEPLTVTETPFVDPEPVPRAHFCRPELVVAVGFGEWTAAGRLRHPTYRGRREDKDPRTVTREP